MRGKSVNEKTKPNKLKPIQYAFGQSLATQRFTLDNENIQKRDKSSGMNRVIKQKPQTSTNIFNFKSSKIPFLLEKNKFDTKPSQVYSVNRASPFSITSKHKSNFGFAYSSGSVPCRIIHGNVKLTLKWDKDIQVIEYDPLLITCFEGLIETQHPYNFVSRECIKNLLSADKAYEKVKPLVSKVVIPLRNALCSGLEFIDNLSIIMLLSNLVKEELNPYLNLLIQQLNKNNIISQYKDKIMELLRTLEYNGGPDALKIIKKKIPTYSGM